MAAAVSSTMLHAMHGTLDKLLDIVAAFSKVYRLLHATGIQGLQVASNHIFALLSQQFHKLQFDMPRKQFEVQYCKHMG